MLKWISDYSKRYPEGPYVVLAILISALLLLGSLTPSFGQCANADYYNYSQRNFYQIMHTLFRCEGVTISENGELITAIATIFIALFTLNLRVSTDHLWHESERQRRDGRRGIFASITSAKAAMKSARISEQTLYITQRPYVSVEPKWSLEIESNTGLVRIIGFWMEESNKGNTPAKHMLNRASAVFLPKGSPDTFDYEKAIGHFAPDVPITIGPQSNITTETQKFTAEKINMVVNKSADLFMSGWIEYDDLFEGTPRHGIEWCFTVAIEGALVPGKCQCRFDAYGEHNRSYECPPEKSRSKSLGK